MLYLRFPLLPDSNLRTEIMKRIELFTNDQHILLIDLCIEETNQMKKEIKSKIDRFDEIINNHCESTDMNSVLLGKKIAVENSDIINSILSRFIMKYRKKLEWTNEELLKRNEDSLFWHIDYTMYSIEFFVSSFHFDKNLIFGFIEKIKTPDFS